MAITLAEITRVTLRQVFLPWLKEYLNLPADFTPSDEELARLADRAGQALRDAAEDKD
jgi:hypothetical protein